MRLAMVRPYLCAALLFAAAGCLGANDDSQAEPQTEVKQGALTPPVGCVHSPCATGGFLEAGCGPDDCTAWICNADPYCCAVAWDSVCVGEVGSVCQRRCDCSSMCTQGNPFYPSACACTAQVFNQDPYCGETWWDGQCVSEAVGWCHISCP
jgi:hypothetical protein